MKQPVYVLIVWFLKIHIIFVFMQLLVTQTTQLIKEGH